MIAALFVQKNGCYYGLPGVDPWDEERDARKYAGPWPVVAHPPCARWCTMAKLVELRHGTKVGEDHGCFASALASVRAYGGVLEHPAASLAFARFRLPIPVFGVWTSTVKGEWVTEVAQVAYGHRARKLTWLFYCGSTPPVALNWSIPTWVPPAGDMRKGRGRAEYMGKRERAATPPAFRDLLLSLAATSALRTSQPIEAAPCRSRARKSPSSQ